MAKKYGYEYDEEKLRARWIERHGHPYGWCEAFPECRVVARWRKLVEERHKLEMAERVVVRDELL